jgi:virginiamycin B lyase
LKSKNIITYSVVAVIAVVVAYYAFLIGGPNSSSISSGNSSQSTAQFIANSRAGAIEQYQKQFCGLNSVPHANAYITEYKLPATCEMPLS